MSSLNKLAIRGIRAFDDKSISVIEFYNPVTVIVGHNGSGKTTIIECLKYATTGDQPPNTKGGAFVHDPNIANEKEVKAQVKLRFHAANGRRMLAIRNLSVSLKKTHGMTMKTLENVLAVADSDVTKGGKRGVLSTKCAEIDLEIPRLLGVSKAVLENVIFCHQEDSYWPLAEASVLKKKFDDIFEATKYTKALENIKAVRKERVAELKLDAERLASLSKEKTHADKLKSRIKALKEDINKKVKEHEELGRIHQQWVARNQKLQDSATKFRETFVLAEGLQNRQDAINKDLKDNMETLEELSESTEELEMRLANFDQHRDNLRNRKSRLEQELRDQDEDRLANENDILELTKQQGMLEGERENYEKNKEVRLEIIRDISVHQKITGYEHSLDENKVDEFRRKLGELQRRHRTRLEEIQRNAKDTRAEFDQKQNDLQEARITLEKARDHHKEEIAKLNRQVKTAGLNLEQSDHQPSNLLSVQSEIEERVARLARLKKDFVQAGYDSRIPAFNTQFKSLEEARDQFGAELAQLSLQSDSRAKLDVRSQEQSRKTAEMSNLIQAHSSKFRRWTQLDLATADIERELGRVEREKEAEQSSVRRQFDNATRDLQQAETSQINLVEQVKRKKAELKASEKKLKDELDASHSNLAEAIKEATEQLQIRRETSGTMQGSHLIYDQYLKTGKETGLCPPCGRHMNKQELAVFEKNLTAGKAKASSTKDQAEDINDWEDELSRLHGLLPVEMLCAKLKSEEIPALERDVDDAVARRPPLADAVEKLSEQLETIALEIKDIVMLKHQATQLNRLRSEDERLKSEIEQLTSQLASSGSSKTSDEVQGELNQVSQQLKKLDKDRQMLTKEKDNHIQLERQQEALLHDLQRREADIKGQLKERDALEKTISDNQKEITRLSTELRDIDAKLSNARHPLDTLRNERSQFEASIESELATVSDQYASLQKDADKLDTLDKQIEEYTKGRYQKDLRSTEKKIEQLRALTSKATVTYEKTREAVAVLDKEIGEGAASAARIRDNLRVRNLKGELDDVSNKLAIIDLEEAGRAKVEYQETWQRVKDQETKAQSACAHLGGELESQKKQLATQLEDLEHFADINKHYKEQLIKVKLSEMANDDLDKYAKALDSAIMKYHSLKMEEVNDTMRHLWNKTYQGTDIDGIKIRSDNEGAANKRSYNYRVVMTKDQVEMDMRGRCSAGQKMLASIIIRLALSDSFGQSCGILALDEPTNALDVDNIDALAASLIDIINERKSVANFQLIIITHDEKFLQKLSQHNVMEYYWRVSRDSHQKSVIERERAA